MKELKSYNQQLVDTYSKYIGKIIYEKFDDEGCCFVKIENVEKTTKGYSWENVRIKYRVWLKGCDKWGRVGRGKMEDLIIFKDRGWSGKKKNYLITEKEMKRLLMLDKLENEDGD